MNDNNTAKEMEIKRNLNDAGMNESQIAECMILIEEKKYTALEKIIAKHRIRLLSAVHQYNNCIDCLDYFTYTLKHNRRTYHET